MYVCMYGHHIYEKQKQGMDQPGKVANPARGQLNRENEFPCPRTCLRIWCRDTGSAVPSRVSLLIFDTQAESGAYSRDSSRFPRRRPYIYLNRHTPSGESRIHRVTQLRTDGVHCRESAGTELVVLKPLRCSFRSTVLIVCMFVSESHSNTSLSREMSRLTRDGTAEPVSRDQILRRERGQGNIIFPAGRPR